MSNYRAVPWKRNLRKVPSAISEKIRSFGNDLIIVATTKKVDDSNRASYAHLDLPEQENEKRAILPISEMGIYSLRNREGWEVKRTDLPMITKTFYWESPNFGDASRFGTHAHYQDREVYQREFNEPRLYEIETTALKIANGSSICRFSVGQILDRTASEFDSELFFALNLLQENCGSIDVFPSSATREDYIKTIELDWEIFPPGTMESVLSSFTRGKIYSSAETRVISDRIRIFEKLKPKRYLRGLGKFGSYIGAQYADDLVVFENLRYGNALYILYEDWQEVSKRSRIDLLKGTDAVFDRIPHAGDWGKVFTSILQREMRNRRL
jgi:hypothetical protein